MSALTSKLFSKFVVGGRAALQARPFSAHRIDKGDVAITTAETTKQVISSYYSDLTYNLSLLNQGTRGTHIFLCDVFFYTRFCHQKKIDPVERLSNEEQTQLVDGMIQALTTMDDNLWMLVRRFGDECLDDGRFSKSGYQYLRDDFLPKLNISNEKREILRKGLDEFATGENFEEISEVIDIYKNSGGPSKNIDDPAIDLRGVPETHDWYLDHEWKQSRRVYGK